MRRDEVVAGAKHFCLVSIHKRNLWKGDTVRQLPSKFASVFVPNTYARIAQLDYQVTKSSTEMASRRWSNHIAALSIKNQQSAHALSKHAPSNSVESDVTSTNNSSSPASAKGRSEATIHQKSAMNSQTEEHQACKYIYS
jgi:hypothetical protein